MTEAQTLSGSAGGPGTAIVTGGSRGIGAAVVRRLARAGYAVVVNFASGSASAERLVAEATAAGGRALAVAGDVARLEDVEALFVRAEREFGAVTALVNNAGITGGFARVADLEREALERVLAVNVAGAFWCARAAVRRMSTARGGMGGAIVNVSSRAAQLGGPGEWVHYAASKGALDALTVGLAREVAAEGIRVNAVAPGLIDTEIHAAAGAPERLTRLAPSVPLARAGTADEVAACVAWLLSPEAAYVTGAIVPVSGGR